MTATAFLSSVPIGTHPGTTLEIVAGMPCAFYFRRRWRAARVLAVRGQEALIEYQMASSTGLRILWLPSLEEAFDRDRPVRYEELSEAWRKSIAA